MTRLQDEDDEHDVRDPELPDEADQDPPGDELASATDECPHCGAEIIWGSEWCPKCGEYLSREDSPSKQATWIVVTAVVCLLTMLLWMLF